MLKTLQNIGLFILMSTIVSSCFLLNGLRTHYHSWSQKEYHFDVSIKELANRLNKVSTEYYLARPLMPEKVESCKPLKDQNSFTRCFNKEENAYQFCYYQGSTTLNQETKIQEDTSCYNCRTELQLINVENIKLTDTIEMDNEFGTMVISGNQQSSKIHTPFGIEVPETKFIAKRKREAFVIEEFEKHIVNKIRNDSITSKTQL